ncbi:hypothetical protein TWF281_007954 [Arthrobotrys megalospora]
MANPGLDVNTLPDFRIIAYRKNDSSHTNEQKQESESRKILRTLTWTYCGPLLPLGSSVDDNGDEVFPPSYHAWHNATIQGPKLITSLKPFLEFAHEFMKSYGLENYCLTIRASLPTDDYNTPRWHTDLEVFPRRGNRKRPTQWGLATTLLGPGTLFAANGVPAREMLRNLSLQMKQEARDHACSSTCTFCVSTVEITRRRTTELLKGIEVVQAKDGDCCFFKAGTGKGSVHSEPPMQCDRIFVGIVPGSEEDLKAVLGNWGMEGFPLDWCLGLPNRFVPQDFISG